MDETDQQREWFESDPDFPRYCTREEYEIHLAELKIREAKERRRRQLMTATTDCDL